MSQEQTLREARVPLDELHADALYLTARVSQGSMTPEAAAAVIRAKIDAALAAPAPAAEPRTTWKHLGGGVVADSNGRRICQFLGDFKDRDRMIMAVNAAAPAATVQPALTDEQIEDIAARVGASDPSDSFWREFARALLAASGAPSQEDA